jgi:hypothetical protein
MPKARPCIRRAGHKGRCGPNLAGYRVGNLVVLCPVPRRKNSTLPFHWTARNTISGKKRNFQTSYLIAGSVPLSGKHGLCYTPEYVSVSSHLNRIKNPGVRHRTYKNMPFCDGWNPERGGAVWKGAQWIIANLGKKPGPNWSLDIIEHDKGFVPGNLRWALHKTQQSNKRHRKLGWFTVEELRIEARRRGYSLVKL